jgi:hypothetical protein
MMRKHVCLLGKDDLDKLPMYAWECLSIETKDRTIDLVIRDQQDMFDFLHFLITKIRTIDGNRGSAVPLMQNRIQAIKHKFRKGLSNEKDIQLKIIEIKMYDQIYRKVLKKYKLIKFRSKISFYGLYYKMTIKELFLHVILKTY